MMWWYGSGMHGWGYIVMTVGGVLLLTVIILGFVILLRGRARGWWAGPRHPAAEELLAERFARGDIDEQEYRERLAALRQSSRVATLR
jgi:putative membrane protein